MVASGSRAAELLELAARARLPLGIIGIVVGRHKNLKEVQTYSQAADRLGLAREALKKQVAAGEKRTKIVKPAGEV